MMETVKHWLQTYPGWEGTLEIDSTGDEPGNTGLFPQGVAEVGRQADIEGNIRCRCQASFLLRRVSLGREEDARWLLQFQDWVRQQSKAGLVPQLGEHTWFQAKDGRKVPGHIPGTAIHSILLVAEYAH